MVTFSNYVRIAHQVADEKGLEVDDPAQFMTDLGVVYRREGHASVNEAAAKDFLMRVVN